MAATNCNFFWPVLRVLKCSWVNKVTGEGEDEGEEEGEDEGEDGG